MEEVIVISYLFNIVGQHREIHTEVRAFGFDWWFEKDGAKAQPASSKENDPDWGYTLQRKIRNDFIYDSLWTIIYGQQCIAIHTDLFRPKLKFSLEIRIKRGLHNKKPQ